MNLFYCHIPARNFGDELNTYLWPRLLPGAFSGVARLLCKDGERIEMADDGGQLFMGIGTLIRGDIPAGATKHVFGSGTGYRGLPRLDGSWKINCVRGPLTADVLGLPPQSAITDPAILVRLLPQESCRKTYRHSFMPHWETALSGDWHAVCRRLGVNYIDPRWPSQTVIRSIRETEVLITEALHGAVVADALRVPWLAVSSRHTILTFKWEDWCRSVGVAYRPASVPVFWKPRPGSLGRAINGAKRVQAALTLSYLTTWGKPGLSGDNIVERLTQRLVDRLASFCSEQGLTLDTSPAW